MSEATDNRLDPCELLAGIEARLIRLAVLITKQGKNQATETNPPAPRPAIINRS